MSDFACVERKDDVVAIEDIKLKYTESDVLGLRANRDSQGQIQVGDQPD